MFKLNVHCYLSTNEDSGNKIHQNSNLKDSLIQVKLLILRLIDILLHGKTMLLVVLRSQ